MAKATITTNRDEFLQREFLQNKRIFKTKDEFEKEMNDIVEACKDCGTFYWRGCRKNCDCEYEKALKSPRGNVGRS